LLAKRISKSAKENPAVSGRRKKDQQKHKRLVPSQKNLPLAVMIVRNEPTYPDFALQFHASLFTILTFNCWAMIVETR